MGKTAQFARDMIVLAVISVGVVLVIVLASALALGHEFYSSACCGGHDCHPVPCQEISRIDDGYAWQGLRFAIGKVLESPDGACHVCVGHPKDSAGVVTRMPQCLYLSRSTS